MIYTNFHGISLSALGYGTMRFPTIVEGEKNRIDIEETRRLIHRAYEQGINYYDTAYTYHNGESEIVTGEILRELPRDTWYLADKYPGHVVPRDSDPKKIFEEQLTRCGVDFFDFYLVHNVNDTSIQIYMDENLAIIDTLLEEKRKGRIRHLGFSCHADIENLRLYLDRWGEHMEFAQIQLNYLDWTLQNAKAKYELLTERGIPVWVMEPARGGALTEFSEENEQRMKELRPDESIASWAFRWLQSLPNVQMVLSGMTTWEALADNLRTFSDRKPLNAQEREVIEEIAVSLVDRVPCTACRYCTAGCPANLDIPKLIHLYNDFRFKPGAYTEFSVKKMDPSVGPQACVACGACVQACPQGIQVPDVMSDFAALIE